MIWIVLAAVVWTVVVAVAGVYLGRSLARADRRQETSRRVARTRAPAPVEPAADDRTGAPSTLG